MLNTNNGAVHFMYPNGLEAKDVVNGYKGIIVYRVQHLTGCDGYGLQAPIEEGKTEIPPSAQVDENRLEVIGKGLLSDEQYEEYNASQRKPGGSLHVENLSTPTKPGGPQISAERRKGL